MKTTIVKNSDHFTLIQKCPYGGNPTILASTTWIKGLTGPTYVQGGQTAALAAIREKQEVGFMPSF